MRNALVTIGLTVTVAYTVTLATLVAPRLPDLAALPLNELGDFLAEAFGPLALLWLILGFMQQGIELQQNTRALELQADELKNSVAQQKELVSVTREQAQAQIAAFQHEQEVLRKAQEPLIVVDGSGGRHNSNQSIHALVLKNVGNHATEVNINTNLDVKEIKPERLESFMRGDSVRVEMLIEGQSRVPDLPVLQISYVNAAGIAGAAEFAISFGRAGQYLSLNYKKVES